MTKPTPIVLGLLLLIFTVLLGAVLFPFWQQLTFAVILALALQPVFEHAHKKVRSRYGAAALTLLLTFIFAGVPLLLLLSVVGYDIVQAADALRQRAAQQGGVSIAVGNWYMHTAAWVIRTLHIGTLLPANFDPAAALSTRLNELSSALLRLSGKLVSGVASFAINLILVLISAFFLLADGKQAIQLLTQVVPLPQSVTERILESIRQTTVANVNAMFVVGAVQGLLVGIGAAIAHLPSPLLIGVAAAICSIVPVFGASIVWVPAGVILILMDQLGHGVFLLVWGVLAVVGIEQILRPVVIGTSLQVHPLLLVLSIFGGAAVFGFIGLFLGPVILAVFRELLQLWAQQRRPILTADE